MGWYEAFKDMAKAAENLKSSELMQKIANVQMEGAKLAEENADLRQDKMDLQKRLELIQDMKYEDNVFWRMFEEGKKEGPFCPKCHEGESQRASQMEIRSDDDYWRCHVCGHCVEKPGRQRQQYADDIDPMTV